MRKIFCFFAAMLLCLPMMQGAEIGETYTGETLHVRVLPWHENASGNGKYICLKNVQIEGMAFEPTEGLESVQHSVFSIQKIVRNGQLLIIRDGKIYNAQGQILGDE